MTRNGKIELEDIKTENICFAETKSSAIIILKIKNTDYHFRTFSLSQWQIKCNKIYKDVDSEINSQLCIIFNEYLKSKRPKIINELLEQHLKNNFIREYGIKYSTVFNDFTRSSFEDEFNFKKEHNYKKSFQFDNVITVGDELYKKTKKGNLIKINDIEISKLFKIRKQLEYIKNLSRFNYDYSKI